MWQTLLIAILIRSVTLIIQWTYGIELIDSGQDAQRYINLAQGATVEYRYGDGSIYPYLFQKIGIYFDNIEILMRLMSFLVGIFNIYLTYSLASWLCGNRLAKYAALLVAIHPTQMLYSMIPLREVYLTTLMLIGAIFLVKWTGQKQLRWIAPTIIAVIIGGAFHTGFILVWIPVLSTAIAFELIRKKTYTEWLRATMIVFLGMVAFLSFDFKKLDVTLPYIGQVSEIVNRQYISERLALAPVGNTNYIEPSEYDSDFQPLAIKKLLYYQGLHIKDNDWPITTVYLTIDGWVQTFLILAMVTIIIVGYTPIEARFLYLIVVSSIIIFATGTSNSGTAARHKSKAFPILVVASFAVLGNRRFRHASAIPVDFCRSIR